MGTSKSFSDVVTRLPNWPAFSGTVTRSCDGSHISEPALRKIMNGYVTAVGGAKKAGRGGSGVAGRSGIKTAKKLGGFLGGFISSGGNLREALKSTGLTDLADKTVSDVINHLIEYCSGPAATIDNNAAKEASRLLLEEIASSASTIEEMQESLKELFQKTSLEDLIIKYFGYYILEHLSSWFYEKLVKQKGKTNCGNLFSQIKDFILAKLKGITKKKSAR